MIDNQNRSVRRVVPDENAQPENTQGQTTDEDITENMPDDADTNAESQPVHHRTVGSTVTHWFTSAGHGISNSIENIAGRFGIPKTVLSVILAVCVVGGGAGAAVWFNNNNTEEIILRQVDYIDDCADEYNEAVNKAPVSDDVDVDAMQLENAEKLWAFGKAMGMTDEQCAGMLGNLTRESGLDPTEIESVYEIWHDEKPYIMDESSPHKWELAQLPSTKMDSYVPGEMKASYKSVSIKLNAYYYNGEDKNIDSKYANHYYCGLGLVQWTGPTAARLVDNAEKLKNQGVKDSEGNDIEWWNMEYQVAHMITSEVDGHGNSRFQNFLNDTGNAGTVGAATASWSGWMEAGQTGPNYGWDYKDRKKFADQWYAKLSSRSNEITKKWASWVDSVVELSEVITGDATGKHAAELDEECDSDEKEETYDNSDIARAAVAFAWETKDMGESKEGFYGTALFKEVREAMFPGSMSDDINIRYRSCDLTVGTAVAWSNADDDYPDHDCSGQLAYLERSPLWEFVGNVGELSADQYQPGDVLIHTRGMNTAQKNGDSHTLLYVSNEIVREKYPNAPDSSQCVSGSLGSRSPSCGDTPNGYPCYKVYRYIGNYEGTKGDNYHGNASGTTAP